MLAERILADGDELGRPSVSSVLSLEFSWLAVGLLVAAGLYLAGVVVLRRRGDAWPVSRTVLFLVPGLGSIAAVTVTGVGTYDDTLLSIHMVQHMVLSMIAPIFLALGAPVTLALRTLPRRPRAVLLTVLHSRIVKLFTYPLVAYAFFVATPFVLYFTGLYKLTMRSDLVHELMHVHFIAVGCLFFWPLLGVDPLPGRWPYPGRALLMFLSTPFHTVLGLTIMQSTTLIGGDWYPSLHLSWSNPFDDQKVAGGILWAGGEFVSITMLAVLVVQWMRQAEKEGRRVDRMLDRQEAEEERRAEAERVRQRESPDEARPASALPASALPASALPASAPPASAAPAEVDAAADAVAVERSRAEAGPERRDTISP